LSFNQLTASPKSDFSTSKNEKKTMSNELYSTHFVNRNDETLGSAPGLLPIPLREGMQITIESHSQKFTVVEWRFHLGHPTDKSGLTIVLE